MFNSIHSHSIIYEYTLYRGVIGGIEPGYFILMFFGKYLTSNKVLFDMGKLLAIIFISVNSLNRGKIFLWILLFTNYYWLALNTELERLQMAYILWAMGQSNFLGGRIYFTLLAIFSHLQISLLSIGSLIKNGRSILTIFMLLIIFIMIPDLDRYILKKLMFYVTGLQLLDFLKASFIALITVLMAKINKGDVVSILIVLLVTLFVGSERTIIIIVLLGIYRIVSRSKITVSGYLYLSIFALKGLVFIYNIITIGRGYI